MNECSVCLTDPAVRPHALACKHFFCEDCIASILEHGNIQCPMCRREIKVCPGKSLRVRAVWQSIRNSKHPLPTWKSYILRCIGFNAGMLTITAALGHFRVHPVVATALRVAFIVPASSAIIVQEPNVPTHITSRVRHRARIVLLTCTLAPLSGIRAVFRTIGPFVAFNAGFRLCKWVTFQG